MERETVEVKEERRGFWFYICKLSPVGGLFQMLCMNSTSEFTIYLGIPQTMKQTHNVKADLQGTVHHGSAEGRRHTVTATAGWPFWAVQ